MARRPDAPCALCGKLLYGGKGALPSGERTCQSCRGGKVARISLCSTEGCPLMSAAKGLCQAHYQRLRRHGTTGSSEISHRVPLSKKRTCPVCASEYEYTVGRQRTCSRKCASIRTAQLRGTDRSRVPWKTCSCGSRFLGRTKYCSDGCRPVSTAPSATLWRECPECGVEFPAGTLGRPRLYCTVRCTSQASARTYRHRRRASQRGGEKFTLWELCERDAWICHLCGEMVDDSDESGGWNPFGNWAPSMDHIVPVSKGGAHRLDNVRLAHRWCNSVRGDGSRDLEGLFEVSDAS